MINKVDQITRFKSVTVLGAGAWGTALAQVAASTDMSVRIWGRSAHVIDDIANLHENKAYLPGIRLNDKIVPVRELPDIAGSGMLLLVTPAQSVRAVCESIKPLVNTDVPLVICSKGIEQGSQKFVTEVAAEILPENPVAILSGPSFAHDVVRGLPTAVTLAAHDLQLAEALGVALRTDTFRLYHTDDVRGVEIGGAAKNVLAIACGIAEGGGLGASAKAALIARGFAELRRFGAAQGARDDTLMGLSGLGDLVLTCSSAQSRNFALGLSLGQGIPISETSGKLVEGAFTANVLAEMAAKSAVEMPIVSAVNGILSGKLQVSDAIADLMKRPQKNELGA